jgi:hypothetical protein
MIAGISQGGRSVGPLPAGLRATVGVRAGTRGAGIGAGATGAGAGARAGVGVGAGAVAALPNQSAAAADSTPPGFHAGASMGVQAV